MVVPPAAKIYSARALAKHFNRLGQLPAQAYLAEERIGSLVFYLDPRLRAGLKPDQVRDNSAAGGIRSRCNPATSSPCPRQQRDRTAGWLDFDGNPCETVGAVSAVSRVGRSIAGRKAIRRSGASGLSNLTLPIRPLLDLGNDAEDLRPLLVPVGPVPVGRLIVGYSRHPQSARVSSPPALCRWDA